MELIVISDAGTQTKTVDKQIEDSVATQHDLQIKSWSFSSRFCANDQKYLCENVIILSINFLMLNKLKYTYAYLILHVK